ncbi:MAG: TetR/AcrR family transcriptional regulator [Candidatus Dormibacteraceae bacterium]
MTVSLREEHADATRVRILSAVVELLEAGQVEELTVPSIAAAAGVSLRTVYRYYPTREKLLEAAARWIGEELFRHPYPRDLDEVAERFRTEAAHFDQRPGLVRVLALSQLGREVRAYRRRGRLDAIRQALGDEVGALPEDELRRAGAVLAYLHNLLAYTTMREENGLSGEDVGEAVAWAIRTLVADLRRRHHLQRRTT